MKRAFIVTANFDQKMPRDKCRELIHTALTNDGFFERDLVTVRHNSPDHRKPRIDDRRHHAKPAAEDNYSEAGEHVEDTKGAQPYRASENDE